MHELMEIDGVQSPVESPENAGELANRVARCATDGTAIYPIGGGMGLDYGTPPSRPGVAISLSKLNRVIDYPVEDLTITVEAGMTIAALIDLLLVNNQRLPIDVPFPDRATVGGAISVDVAGARRLGYGTWRDRVIGITVVNDRGELCSAGGRVVKNVAGYDLGKLYTGSLGSFGIITQVTLKLQPKPETQTWVTLRVDKNDLVATLNQLSTSQTQPIGVELLSVDNDPQRFDLAVLYEDNADAVAWQREQLIRECPHAEFNSHSQDWVERFTKSPRMADCAFRVIATMPPSAVAGFVQDVHSERVLVHGHAQSGIVRLGFASINQNEAITFARRILALATAAGGNSVIRRCPTEWKSSLPIWGRPPAGLDLMKKIKREFDPKNILNPGRTAIG